jgi:RNA polymerase sigma-70 factor (ECF subfamily)
MSETPPQTLANRLARGEDAAFAELYDACANGLYRYATLRLRSQDAAADVIQSAFLRAVKSRRRFRKVESPAAYLFQIVRNETIRAAARLKRNERQTPADALEVDAIHDAFADHHPAAFEDAQALAAAVAMLDAIDQEIVELKLQVGLTFAEIAVVLDRPQGTIATRYRRALETLRTRLHKQFAPD